MSELKPKELKPVLAEISQVNDLGTSNWHQVIYWDEGSEEWCTYGGDRAFTGGEQVKAWVYADEAMKPQSQWVAVTDRLPKLDSDGGIKYSDVYIESLKKRVPDCLYYEEDNAWIKFEDASNLSSNFVIIEGVTHWMPLPCPPEQ